jgi:hypothetical protein
LVPSLCRWVFGYRGVDVSLSLQLYKDAVRVDGAVNGDVRSGSCCRLCHDVPGIKWTPTRLTDGMISHEGA